MIYFGGQLAKYNKAVSVDSSDWKIQDEELSGTGETHRRLSLAINLKSCRNICIKQS